jgi:hypothetical protein
MKRPTLLLWEHDGRLASWLRPWASIHGCLFRQPRTAPEALSELALAQPGVLVLRLGHEVEAELALLAQATIGLPHACVFAVLDSDPALASLAWDLGARWVLPLSRARDELPSLLTDWFRPVENKGHAPADR